MSTHQDLIPELHTRTSKRTSKDRQTNICRGCWQIFTQLNFLGASQKKFHTSTNAEHLQNLSARKDFFWGIATGSQISQKDLYEIMQEHLKDCRRTSSRSSHEDHQELYRLEPHQERPSVATEIWSSLLLGAHQGRKQL